MTSRANRVKVFSTKAKFSLLEAKAKKVSTEVLDFLKKKGFILEVYLVDSSEMRSLNWRFRGRDQTTNVLSFPSIPLKVFYEPRSAMEKRFKNLGEVYLDPGYINREGQKFERMLSHGLLHLLGYDHSRPGEARKMERLEEKLRQGLGF